MLTRSGGISGRGGISRSGGIGGAAESKAADGF
jgi:hypothetical protein